MPKDYSPFTPGQPVPFEFFVGRSAEAKRLMERVDTSTVGRLQTVFLSGERGIGKSSLATLVRISSERDHQVVGLHTYLGGVSSLEEMVRRVFERLLNESVDTAWFGKIKDLFGGRIRKVGLFGVDLEFGASDQELQSLVRNFGSALRGLVKRLGDEKRGLLIVLDDINGLAASPDFANWLKSLVDEISTSGDPLPLCLVLVGLEERRRSLIKLNPSLARVFDLIDIQAWSDEETGDFYKKAFGKVDVSVEKEALRLLVMYTGGLPVLAHEIGEAAFRVDEDNHISMKDAMNAIGDAAATVGRKHLEPQVFNAIQSEQYRDMLRKLALESPGSTFTRSELRERLNDTETKVLDNFLRKMKQLGVIRSEGGPGAYRFQNLLHEVYFRMEAMEATNAGKS